jgi:hypothetical protein
MSNSAKPDASKADVEQAATKPAAAVDKAAADDTAAADTAAADSAAADTAATDSAMADGAAAGSAEEAKPADIDEMKRKFREALDRKHQAHAENSGQGGHDPGKIHGAHGPAGNRRSFRRKSG